MALKIWQAFGLFLGLLLILGFVIPLLWTILNSAVATFVGALLILAALAFSGKIKVKRHNDDFGAQ